MDPSKNQPPPPYNSGNEFSNPGYGGNHNNGPSQQPSPGPMHHPQPTVTMAPPATQTTTHVVVSGGALVGCPVCHNNSWTGSYSCCAWLLAICCFPCGIICCCCMRRKKCTKCGYTVG